MEEWQKIRKRYFLLEVAGIVLISVCFLVGIWSDWSVLARKNALIIIENIESFSLTILQIQATVGTLIIAIIALITGNISDSHMGVSVSDFYLNIKPWKLKQKILIFLSLGLCLAGVICHSLKLYNAVFYLFVATLIVVTISVIEIYSAFRGKNIGNFEIEAYINYILKSNAEFSKKENIYQNFVSDWKVIIDSQDKQSYEKYLGIFKECMFALLSYGTAQSEDSIQQQCYSIAYSFLGAEKKITRERGIEFIQKVYDVLWETIYKDKLKETSILANNKYGFYLFSEICGEMVRSMEDINAESIEKKIRFSNLSDSIQRIAIWSRYDVDESNSSEEELEKSRRSRVGYDNEISQLNLNYSRNNGINC